MESKEVSEVNVPMETVQPMVNKERWFPNLRQLVGRVSLALAVSLGGGVIGSASSEVIDPTVAAADTGGYPQANAFAYNRSQYDWRVDENGDGDYTDGAPYYEWYSQRMYAYRNCTDYVAWKLESLGIPPNLVRGRGNGADWDNISNGAVITSVPEAGDAAVWNNVSPPYGHVAFVEATRLSSSGGYEVQISEYNGNGDGNYGTRGDKWIKADDYVDFNGIGRPLGNKATTNQPAKPQAVVARTPSGLLWYIKNTHGSGNPDVPPFYYGGTDLMPVMGDWDGNGTTTIGAVARTTNGLLWYLKNSNGPGNPDITPFYYGGPDLTPVTGDWDGNGTTSIGAVAKSGGGLLWYLRNSISGGNPDILPFYYGGQDLVPVTGDWDGDRKTSIGAVARTPSGLLWYLRNSNNGGDPNIAPFYYGGSNLTPISGNWDAVNGDSIGAVAPTPSGLLWYLRNNNSSGDPNVSPYYYGGQDVIPVN